MVLHLPYRNPGHREDGIKIVYIPLPKICLAKIESNPYREDKVSIKGR